MEKIMTLCGTDTTLPVMSSGPILALEFLGFYSSAYSKGFKAFYNFVESNYFISLAVHVAYKYSRCSHPLIHRLESRSGKKESMMKNGLKRFELFRVKSLVFQFVGNSFTKVGGEICYVAYFSRFRRCI